MPDAATRAPGPDRRRGAELEAWVRRPKSAQRLALRSRIVPAAADGRGNTAIATDLGVCLPTVGKRLHTEWAVDAQSEASEDDRLEFRE